MLKKDTELIRITQACKIFVLVVHGFSAYALYQILHEITGMTIRPAILGIGFFLVNLYIHKFKDHIVPPKRYALVVFVFGIKLAMAFVEAILLSNSLVSHSEVDVGTGINNLIQKSLDTNLGIILILFVIIFGLDVVASILPTELGKSIVRWRERLRPGKSCEISFDVSPSSEAGRAVIIRYNVMYPAFFRFSIWNFVVYPAILPLRMIFVKNELRASLYRGPRSDELQVQHFGIISGSGEKLLNLKPDHYTLVVEYPAKFWFLGWSREFEVEVREALLE